MVKNKVISFRRKSEGKTNYSRRLDILKSNNVRLVVRKSLKHILAQLAQYSPHGDRIVVSFNSKNLKKYGWKYSCNNLPASYFTGVAIGKKGLEKNIRDAVLDIGMHTSVNGSRIYAVLKGAIDAGLKVPHDACVIPTEDRLSGKHIEAYARKAKESKGLFSSYLKNNADPAKISENFKEVKERLLKKQA